MKKYLLTTIFSIVLFNNCTKEEPEYVLVKMYYKETNCANPWDALPESENYLTAVQNYLKENKVSIDKISIKRVSEKPAYGSCYVLSGRRIYIELLDKYEDKALGLGFIPY